jgi:phosphate uptake regulator
MPKAWVRENKLKKGDLLNIEEKKDELLICIGQNEKKEEPKGIFILIDHKEMDLIRTEVVSAYLNNYDIIEIKSETKGELEKNAPKIKAILRNLTGMEIIQQDSTRIIAKDLLNLKEISIVTLIRRMDNIVRSMMIDSIGCVHEDHYESIYERDLDVNRLVYLSYRVLRAAMMDSKLAKSLGETNIQLMSDWIMVTKLEKVGDKSKRIARHMRNTNLTSEEKKELESALNMIKESYYDVMKAYYKRDIETAFRIEVTNKERIIRCNNFIKGKHNADTHKLIEVMKSISTSIKYIARAVIGMEKNVLMN